MRNNLLFLCVLLSTGSCRDEKLAASVEIEISRAYYYNNQLSCDSLPNFSQLSQGVCCLHLANKNFDKITVVENDSLCNQSMVSPDATYQFLKDSTENWISYSPYCIFNSIRRITINKNQGHRFFLMNIGLEEGSKYRILNTYRFFADSAGYKKEITLEVFSDDLSYSIITAPGQM